jgi:hypothetical protein
MHNLRHFDSFNFNAESGLSISQYLQIYPLFILLKYNQGYVTSYYLLLNCLPSIGANSQPTESFLQNQIHDHVIIESQDRGHHFQLEIQIGIFLCCSLFELSATTEDFHVQFS